jgi:hypothetical protein
MNKIMMTAVMTAVLGASVAQAAFADHGKVTTITTRNYGTPVVVGTPVVIENPSTTTTTVTRRVEQPVMIEQTAPVILERQTTFSAPVMSTPVIERRVEILNNAVPSSSSTTVTRTTIERN